MTLSPKVPPQAALVTGAAQRVGKALAVDLVAEGWAVAIHCNHSREPAEALADDLRRKGGRVAVVSADLGVEAEVGKLVRQATEALGPLSLLVNNASTFEEDTIENATRESWDKHMEANLRAPFHLAQDFVAQAPAGAVIVNIIDQRVWRLTPKFLSYTLSKAGLWTLTQTLAQALAPKIRVNAIGPGPLLPSSRQDLDSFQEQVAALPLQRHAGLQEMCAALRFILETPSMTGQMIALDGGQHLSWQTPDVMVRE